MTGQARLRRAQHVVRLNDLSSYFGNQRTQNEELARLGLIRLFSMSPGGRSKVVTESNIAELQDLAQAAGSLDRLIEVAEAVRTAVKELPHTTKKDKAALGEEVWRRVKAEHPDIFRGLTEPQAEFLRSSVVDALIDRYAQPERSM